MLIQETLNRNNFDFFDQGQNELRSIAQSYKKEFPELFDVPYDRLKFHFQHTEAERTRDSFYAFVDEIFGENAHTKINAEPTEATQALLKVCLN